MKDKVAENFNVYIGLQVSRDILEGSVVFVNYVKKSHTQTGIYLMR